MGEETSDYLLPLRERIIELARIWDEESVEPAEDFADAVLDALGLEQVGWADDSEPGAAVLMTMHFKPKVPSLWRPIYRLATDYFGRTVTDDAR